MKRLPQILLIALLLSTGVAKAQSGTEVYEYATVVSENTVAPKVLLYVSFSNGEYKEIELDKNNTKPNLIMNQTTVLKYIAELTKEGWEVVDGQISGRSGNWYYFLKRKQK